MTQEWNSLLAHQGLTPDAVHFGNPAGELLAARDGGVVAPLLDLGVIRASGEDAAAFLHNLVSNDVKGIDVSHARFAGLCTPKGRLLALLLIWREGDDLLLMLPRDILPAILKRLSMYVLRSKVKLTDATEQRVLIGIAAPNLPAPVSSLPPFGVSITASGQWLRLDDRRCLLVCTPESAIAQWPQQIANAHPVGTAAWQWLEIAAGQPRVVAATQEAFVPQMLNMELPAVAGVSFTKGCYPGQEIVARTQYLGKVKRRTYRVRLASYAAPGTHVFAPETGAQHCGTLVSIAPSPDGGHEALVCVQISAFEAGELHVGTPDGECLERLSLPYPIS
jgi:folate-binding protein YgfZ